MTRSLTIVIALVAAVACSKKDDAGDSESGGGKSAAKPAPKEYKPIPWMGLQAEVPGDATISDTSADAPNASIQAGRCTVMVSTVTAAYPSSFEAAVASAEKGAGNEVETWVVKEETEDGFHLEFDGTSLLDEPIKSVTVRRTIGNKQIECNRAGDAEQVACVVEVCKSLKPL